MDELNPDIADLESGVASSREDLIMDASPPNSVKKKRLKRALGGALCIDGLPNGKVGVDICSSSFSHGKDAEDSISVVVDRNLEDNDKENAPFLDLTASLQEQRHWTNPRKPPKPPRPPKGPLLDVADQKFVKDMAEIAMSRRLRMARMKALKKAKSAASSRSSSFSNLAAMLVTVLFFLVIVFQGLNSRYEPRPQDPPGADVLKSESMISVHRFHNLPSDEGSSFRSKSWKSPAMGKIGSSSGESGGGNVAE